MYIFKHIVAMMTAPLVIAMLIALAATVVRWRRRRRASAALFVASAIFAYLSCTPLVGSALLGPLERQFPALRDDQALGANCVVVLGSGYDPQPGLPVTAALDSDGLVRIVEGVRLTRHFGIRKLVVSGGAPAGAEPSAHGYAILARELGVEEEKLVISDASLDTAAEAYAIARLLGNTPFLLVTDAYHMPRAMKLMRLAGARAIPAPTGREIRGTLMTWRDLLPSSGGLGATEQALHEYLGLFSIALGLH